MGSKSSPIPFLPFWMSVLPASSFDLSNPRTTIEHHDPEPITGWTSLERLQQKYPYEDDYNDRQEDDRRAKARRIRFPSSLYRSIGLPAEVTGMGIDAPCL